MIIAFNMEGYDYIRMLINSRGNSPIKESSNKSASKSTREGILCKICFTNNINVVLIPCGHSLCNNCVDRLSASKQCPFCRASYISKNNLYV